ncbi:hypothetical protein O6H91_08G055900 [Diphasiastrum complanatum]|uniref:Uncharacterized protein n=3 Tax=Diphasiastrum complanatum TaxID=34168 RepID=A0ACC2CXS1_DIPCM|nr:hypothetical protein O6H91_08G055900 [Diphasiastrum complanatum]KAJ7546823.1 hypothetical protein O6H91_08G055900 [Diphasiastrum complanatum]KAJ7546824.1 hypothetical protein O6H91_08G055900 [Diphasiastrum complanatum]
MWQIVCEILQTLLWKMVQFWRSLFGSQGSCIAAAKHIFPSLRLKSPNTSSSELDPLDQSRASVPSRSPHFYEPLQGLDEFQPVFGGSSSKNEAEGASDRFNSQRLSSDNPMEFQSFTKTEAKGALGSEFYEGFFQPTFSNSAEKRAPLDTSGYTEYPNREGIYLSTFEQQAAVREPFVPFMEKPRGRNWSQTKDTETQNWMGYEEAVQFRLTESCLLVLHRGDITKWHVNGFTDAIVNAAKPSLLGGAGVDGAIHRAAGPKLKQACRMLPNVERVRCPVGHAVITEGFELRVSRVIHTVGPIYDLQERRSFLLRQAYKSSLNIAAEQGIEFIAFPAISCGVYGYPYAEAAEIALETVKDQASSLLEIHFFLFEKEAWEAWMTVANSRFERPQYSYKVQARPLFPDKYRR